MITADKQQISRFEELARKRREEIRNTPDELVIKGTIYYVSSEGDDSADGLSPETPWKTLEKVSGAELKRGDGVLFRRGDLFRGRVVTVSGVSYGAYGTGEKPKFYGWDKSLADSSLWSEFDSELHIWKLNEKIIDVGTLVFNDGEYHSVKLIPSYIGGRFVCRDKEDRVFDMRREMVRDLDIYWHFEDVLTTKPSNGESFPVPDVTPNSWGELYLRCDRGNPGEVFRSVEPTPRRSGFSASGKTDVHIDNLCLKYIGVHAISAGGEDIRGLKVTNCEIGWIGGTIMNYLGVDPNYPAGGRGTVTRFGNGVEIYGGCDGYEVSNCYIYQVYDAGITHQVNTKGRRYVQKNVLYKDNLVEKCVYAIEYFLDRNGNDTESYMENIEMCGNILRLSGYGWGQQRHNVYTPSLIKGWSYENTASNYRIHHNIFDRCGYSMLHVVAKEEESCPEMWDNTYIQYRGGPLGQYGGNCISEPVIEIFDEKAEEKINGIFGDKTAKVYIIED